MNPGSILILTLVFFVLIAIFFQWYRWKEIKNDTAVLDVHYQKFLKADLINDINGIQEFGNLLIWNRHLETKQLNVIMKAVNSRVENYPELEKLSNAIFNKNRHLIDLSHGNIKFKPILF